MNDSRDDDPFGDINHINGGILLRHSKITSCTDSTTELEFECALQKRLDHKINKKIVPDK